MEGDAAPTIQKPTRARQPKGTANPQRVAQLPADKYHNINWVQCLRQHFDCQTAVKQRAIRATISTYAFGELTPFGFTVEQLTVALTIPTADIPSTILAANEGVNFDKLGF